MRRHRIVKDPRATYVVRELISRLGLDYIKPSNIVVVRNLDSKSSAYARIYALPRPIMVGFDLEPLYAIEIIQQRFKALDCETKIRVLVHELLHIPRSFSGGLLPHRSNVFSKIDDLVKSLKYEDLCSLLS